MLDTSRVLYSYNDVMIMPAVVSEINSRSECNPFLEDGKLPIFTAPMSTVVNLENRQLFEDNHITTILPRNIAFKDRYEYVMKGAWAAFSLNEFIEHFCNPYNVNETDTVWRVLIDIANGHMKKMFDAVKEAKSIHHDKIEVMVGNIANPETFRECVNSGVSMVRCAIGAGNGCITSTSVSIHYPIASLLDDIMKVKHQMIDEVVSVYGIDHVNSRNMINRINSVKVIADGGIRGYGDVIKGFSLGADYVMIGGLFASLEESAGEKVIGEDGKPYKVFYGMASREGQIAINGEKTKTSEGTKKYLPISGTVGQWSTNMADYIKSAMSYCNIRDIKDFNADNVTTILISNNTKNSINK